MARRTIDRQKVQHEIELKIRAERSIKWRTKAFAEEVAAYWRDVAWPEAIGVPPAKIGPGHPYQTGRYRDSIKVVQDRVPGGRREGGRYLSAWKVVATSFDANFIEYGTGPDKPGSKSPWGPYTPTPEFAPAARTAHHFRGTAP